MSNDEHVASYKNETKAKLLTFQIVEKMKLKSFLTRKPSESLKSYSQKVHNLARWRYLTNYIYFTVMIIWFFIFSTHKKKTTALSYATTMPDV